MSMRYLWIWLFIFPYATFAYSNNDTDSAGVPKQDTPALTLEDCLAIGIEQNLGLKNERIDVEQAEIRSTIYKRSLIFPDINTSARLSGVHRPGAGEEPRIRQSARAYTNFTIFDMEIGPRKRKYENYIRLHEYGVDSETADLARDIAVAYLQANLVRKQQDILIDQLLELDSIYDLSRDTIVENSSSTYVSDLNRLRDNISPLQEVIKTQLKALETNYDDKIGQLNNLMSLETTHNFRLADNLQLTGNIIVDENKFIKRLVDETIRVRTVDDELRKQNLQEDMKMVNAAFFPEIDAGVAYEEDFMTSFKGFSVNIMLRYNVYDPNARRRKDLARLDIEQINNSILENKRDMERWLRSNYNKSKEYRSQVRPELIAAQKKLYRNNLEEFLSGKSGGVSATDVIEALKDYYDAREDYYRNIAYSEIQKMHIRFLLMDFTSPFEQLGVEIQQEASIEDK